MSESFNPNGRPKKESVTQGPATLSRSLDKECSQTIELNLNVRQIDYINALYKTGLYGNSPTETARRVFDIGLRSLVEPCEQH